MAPVLAQVGLQTTRSVWLEGGMFANLPREGGMVLLETSEWYFEVSVNFQVQN